MLNKVPACVFLLTQIVFAKGKLWFSLMTIYQVNVDELTLKYPHFNIVFPLVCCALAREQIVRELASLPSC